jgi:DNA-binding MarR family transcriptional regulator
LEFPLPIARLDEQLCFALYSASSHLTSIYRPLLAPLGITYTQFIVLMALWENDGVAISRLAERTGLTNATMTPLLKRLEQKGLIERQQLADNERQKHIVLTEAGHQLSRHSSAITEKAFCATQLTRRQANDLIALCHRIANTDLP